jgi:hypothetical protein
MACFDKRVQTQELLLDLFIAGTAGFTVGVIVSRIFYVNFLNSPQYRAVIREELRAAFKHGMLAAADFVTMEGEEGLAGMVRQSAEIIATTCDHHEIKI